MHPIAHYWKQWELEVLKVLLAEILHMSSKIIKNEEDFTLPHMIHKTCHPDFFSVTQAKLASPVQCSPPDSPDLDQTFPLIKSTGLQWTSEFTGVHQSPADSIGLQ